MAEVKIPRPSEHVLAARQRRAARASANEVRMEWFIDRVSKDIGLTMQQRVLLATSFLRDKIVRNISIPVEKGIGPRGGRIRIRSKPGEFPRADTTQLRKTIIDEVKEIEPGVYEGYVGTPLDYGLILELRLDRSFLVRTLQEEQQALGKILSEPIK